MKKDEEIKAKKEEAETQDKQLKEVDSGKITVLKKEFEDLEKRAKEKDALWDKYLRLYAEYENSKKAWQKQKEELLKFANFRILKEFVTFLDEIEVALNSLENILDKEKIQQGLEMIHSKLKNFLEKEGLREIDTQGKFNPHFHEALFFEERQDLEEHTIIEVIQKGYLYEDKVLRTAKVKVSVKPKKVETEKIEESNK
ncbi:MAG TPA: nucleotide exchange factor GrpE [Candidatus Omnitrophica bacterium]|nr:MAG: nucleotide exchange factor GrpE [Candidatus Omnitrophota bacterium]RKY34547.1 MAG: nucleotide exchange factor GrpE [Candidatus Omnitrophota bacterium]RKY43494.1 MAG: nucleotide exchange factor GrpE [Candidatus Omnitrophota bacterium]HEC70032.1 nucleotide exchange factor GrpE [Candidatus Omnitrophota bacterium]